MPRDTVESIEDRIKRADIPPEKRRQLLGLLDTLKGEVESLARTHGDDAQSIASLADVSAQEAVRPQPKPEVLKLSLAALDKSVEDFETSHPSLVRIVNEISMMLSNIGI